MSTNSFIQSIILEFELCPFLTLFQSFNAYLLLNLKIIVLLDFYCLIYAKVLSGH